MARFLPFLLVILLFACNDLEDAKVPERQTFIRFFGSPVSYSSVVVEPDLDGGFVMAGNVAAIIVDPETDERNYPGIVIVKTDNQGTKIWEKIIRKANAHSIKPVENGYLVTGEGIENNPKSSESSEFVNQQFLLLKLTKDGDPAGSYSYDSTVTVTRGTDLVTLKVDFKASSSVLINNGTEIATMGSYKVPGGQERTITMGFNFADISAPIWRKNLDLQNFNYVSTNFLGLSNGNLVWASTATPTDANQSKYMSVISVPPNYASPSNNSLLGKNEIGGGHDVLDMQPSATGFATIGTYTNQGGKANVFFAKVDPAGNVDESSAKYFDCGATDETKIAIAKGDDGTSQDAGTAITYTRDGGFALACSMASTPEKGNGGTDIVLIKIDAFGNYKWNKLLGGTGNEVATSIRELADGSLLVAGTSTISNISSMFIIRADANGNLKE